MFAADEVFGPAAAYILKQPAFDVVWEKRLI
jgi:hypothetical protein